MVFVGSDGKKHGEVNAPGAKVTVVRRILFLDARDFEFYRFFSETILMD